MCTDTICFNGVKLIPCAYFLLVVNRNLIVRTIKVIQRDQRRENIETGCSQVNILDVTTSLGRT